MGKQYNHLTAEDRQLICRLHDDKIPVSVIALHLGRHKSTIHRELRRNRTDDGPWLRGYFAMAANQLSAMRRRRSAKLHRDPALAAHVVARLKDGWSPEQIAGRLALDRAATAICHERVYRHVYSPAGRAAELYRHLPSQRRRRRVRYARRPRGLHIPDANTIAKRPAEIGERRTFGHWECDLVAFRQVFGKHNITSLVERRSRYLFISRNPSRHSANIMAGLVRDLGPLPPACRRSITFDRGTEFAGFPSLKQSLGTQSYFCAPSAPWQKGTVENTNGRLRRFLPLDLDVSTKTTEELAALARRMNATSRKCLGFRTPTEVFSEFVAKFA
ncbi:MAG: IS30 family transposase [Caulobacteraceae bacterium]